LCWDFWSVLWECEGNVVLVDGCVRGLMDCWMGV
jgi:hypothetical protein